MSRPDTSSEEYRTSLKNSLRWDSERDEPYLQLPSFSELRITPARQGDGEDIVSHWICACACLTPSSASSSSSASQRSLIEAEVQTSSSRNR